MRTCKSIILVAALATTVLPQAALAHPGHDGGGVAQGFVHPFSGLDHVLAMVMVGLVAQRIGGRALWLVPGAFVCVMTLAGVFGMLGFGLLFVEIGIGLSVVVLGAIVAFSAATPMAIAIAVAGVSAIFHGHAHGAEVPSEVSGLSYAAGFVIATAALHAAGIGLGILLGRSATWYSPVFVRSVGALTVIAGLGLTGGVL